MPLKFSIKDFFSKCDQIRSFLRGSVVKDWGICHLSGCYTCFASDRNGLDRVTNFEIPGRGLGQDEHRWRRVPNLSCLWSPPKVAYPLPFFFVQLFSTTLPSPSFCSFLCRVSLDECVIAPHSTFNMIFYWMI